MKINGFLKDVGGAGRVVEARRELIASGDPSKAYSDHIGELARELHPAQTHVRIARVEDVSLTARRFTFVADQGDVLPPFRAGQYCSLDLKVARTLTTRPYSISSAPFQARERDAADEPETDEATGGAPFFQLTIRNGRPGQGFAANWLYGLAKPGDAFVAHLPFGQFYYEPLRDARHVVALAGGSGITPFFSMAREIAHGTLDCDLTILYGSATTDDIILKDQLEAIARACPRVRLVNVISGGETRLPEGYERGLLTAELIDRHAHGLPEDGETTYFVCGPLPMYRFVAGELAKLRVPERRIRMEVFGSPRDPRDNDDYPGPRGRERFQLTVHRGQQTDVIGASSLEPLAVALERAHIPNNTRCRSGACGWCRCRLLSGEVYVPAAGDGRRWADKEHGYVHACSTWPLTDCEIEVPIV